MKKRMKMFGGLCAAALVLAVACNTSDDGTSGDATYAVGNIVKFEGQDYLVTKNTETAARSAARASVNSDSGLYYQNEQAAAYRENWLREYGMTEYVELFNITKRKEESTKGLATLNDIYLILQNNKKVFQTQQTWDSKRIFPDLTTTERAERFNALTEDAIRQSYDPDDFTFQNYPGDTSNKIRIQYIFNRNDDGTTNFDSLKKTVTYKAYVSLSKSKQQPIYKIEDRPEPDGKKAYSIHDPNSGSNFFHLWFEPNGTFWVNAEGAGTLGGSTSQSVYRNKVLINKICYDTDTDNVAIRYKVQQTVNDEPTIWDEKWQTWGNNPERDNTYVHVSDEMTPVATHDVPKEITFSAPFLDTTVALNPYTNVTFVPEEQDDGTIIYMPKKDEQYDYDFIACYAQDFESLFVQ